MGLIMRCINRTQLSILDEEVATLEIISPDSFLS